MPVYVAFLRGINVGGKHKVKMEKLRSLCEDMGLSNVRTYIQSGNAVFSCEEDTEALVVSLEAALEQAFGFAIPVMLRTAGELAKLIEAYPFTARQRETARAQAAGAETEYVYLWNAPPDGEPLAALEESMDGDHWALCGRELYLLLSRSIIDSKLAASLGKALPPATARNLRTLSKVAELAQGIKES